jgi:uncharacterized membrane protein
MIFRESDRDQLLEIFKYVFSVVSSCRAIEGALETVNVELLDLKKPKKEHFATNDFLPMVDKLAINQNDICIKLSELISSNLKLNEKVDLMSSQFIEIAWAYDQINTTLDTICKKIKTPTQTVHKKKKI